MENQMEKKIEMKWKLGLLWAVLGLDKVQCFLSSLQVQGMAFALQVVE